MPRKTRVAVVFGGRSGEHAISCVSAASVLRSIDRSRYDVVPMGILSDGRWVLAADDPAGLEPQDGILPSVGEGPQIALVPGGWRALGSPAALEPLDVVFPLLHGPYGEDGTIQGLLEMVDLPYVGAGVFASATAMDKEHMKAAFIAADLPVGAYLVLRPGDENRAPGPGPWFVKPARAGSSLGITKVRDYAALAAAVECARRHDPKVVVEAIVAGREIECGVLDGFPPTASVPAEIHVHPDHEFYDYQAKYLDGSSTFDVPADLDAATTAQIQDLALRAFAAVDCAGLARVDFFLTAEGPVVNEINTMPGFTRQSMYPRMWSVSGLDLPALVDALIQVALARGSGLR